MAQISCKAVPKSVVEDDEDAQNEGTPRAVLCNTENPGDPLIVFTVLIHIFVEIAVIY